MNTINKEKTIDQLRNFRKSVQIIVDELKSIYPEIEALVGPIENENIGDQVEIVNKLNCGILSEKTVMQIYDLHVELIVENSMKPSSIEFRIASIP